LLDDAEAQVALAMPTGAGPATAVAQQLESELFVEQGLIQMQRGQLDAAVTALRKALEMDATQGPVHRHLAQAYLQQRAFALAAEHAAEAEKLGAPLADAERSAIQQGLGSQGAAIR
jgi:Flp pilus assembly protein TadD